MKRQYDIDKDRIREWLKQDGKDAPNEEVVRETEDALIQLASKHGSLPPPNLKEKILAKIRRLNEQKKHNQSFEPGQYPLLDENSHWLHWQQATRELAPPATFDNYFLHSLESNEKRELFVIWVKEYVEEEVHHDLLESFLILEGTCECHITNEEGQTRMVRMAPGDFISIKLGETHNIQVTSREPAKAILQWRKQVA